MNLMTSLLSTCLFLITPFMVLAQNDKDLKIEKVSDDLYIYTTYGTFEGVKYAANALYTITKEGVVVFDCPWDPGVNEQFEKELYNRHQLPIIANIATHSHADRAGGLAFFKKIGARTYTSKATDSILEKTGEPRAEYIFKSDTIFHIGDKTFEVFYPGKGHTSDNLVVWFPEEQILLGGCIIKDGKAKDLGNIEEAYPDEWAQSLQRVVEKFPKPKLIIAGHDDWHPQNGIQHTLDLLSNFHHD